MAELAPQVRRVTAPNAGMMTGPGTNTYIVGVNEVAVIDPGPRIEAHLEKILNDAPGPIRWILTTHTHPDHSPAAAPLAQRTGAELIGMPAPDGTHQDKTYSPHRIPSDGDVLETPEFRLQMIHTPGHASNHVCYLQEQPNWLYTGDHIMNGSTVVIDPPDGNMADYIRSLEKLKQFPIDAIAPGHGDLLHEPFAAVDWLIAHRFEREEKVIEALAEHPESTSVELVPFAYREVDEKLYGWAERSLLAHLGKLEEEGRARFRDGRWQLVS
ncbi:MAG: MBL fold metallo-hydrolase [Gammaproteobacteria bacterium]|nr:MBL fold metallo-hydrolase [Gammaproteobacteria bacterium]